MLAGIAEYSNILGQNESSGLPVVSGDPIVDAVLMNATIQNATGLVAFMDWDKRRSLESGICLIVMADKGGRAKIEQKPKQLV